MLGASILGPHAEELANLFALAIRAKVPAAELRDVLFAYPTAASDVEYVVVTLFELSLLVSRRNRTTTGRTTIALAGLLTLPLGSGFTVNTPRKAGPPQDDVEAQYNGNSCHERQRDPL